MSGEIRAAGDRALLVIPESHGMLPELLAALRSRPEGVADVLPAAETVLVTLSTPAAAESVRSALNTLLAHLESANRVGTGARVSPGRQSAATASPDLAGADARFGSASPDARPGSGGTGSDAAASARIELGDLDSEPLHIPVRYDGEDLTEVARLLGITRDEVVAQHTSTVWRCAFVGFAPGFGYLESPDGRLTVPRRGQSRTAIPAGAVALAAGYSAVYPRRSPGGWQLIGTTDAALWDVDRDPPALIRAATAVRFFDVEAGRS